MASADGEEEEEEGGGRRRGGRAGFFFGSDYFPLQFFGTYFIFLGQVWAEGKGELATCRHCADSGRETWIKSALPNSRWETYEYE